MSAQKSEKELAAELHAHRGYPGEWEEQLANIDIRPGRSAIVSFRLPTAEFLALTRRANRAGESLSEFIRKAIVLRMSGAPAPPVIDVSAGAYRMTVHSHYSIAPRTNNPLPLEGDLVRRK